MDRYVALSVFRRVIECDGFSAAARDLGYSNAAVSKIIKDLEADLGAPLIVRTTRSLSLTDIGQAYFDRACRLLDDWADMDEAARASGNEPRGLLRVSLPMSLGVIQLSAVIADFSARYPQIRIDLELGDRYVDLVGEGFDLAIRGGGLQDSSLRARKLMAIERGVCAAPAYLEARGRPETPAELTQHEALIFTLAAQPHAWTLESGGARESVSVKGRFRANNSLALRDAAIAGSGLAFIPLIYAREAMAAGHLVRVLPDWSGETQHLYGVYPAHRETSRKLRLFLDFLVDSLGGLTGRERA
ncbi:LysR family transcriptional regulator [Maricaulis parjimensis]|uniref:LysR family transcriptional regulator n=1 Tax=Maricaulis parjimensis TaxID=144023 RepID=UPI001939D78D|nr:LysR family transcriptional regulator [Maricaulis parjimensis]